MNASLNDKSRQQGFTYLAILFAIAVMGIGASAVSEIWVTASRRDKERDLLYAGRELRAAIGRYYEQSGAGIKRYPPSLDDLLTDKRFPSIKRHLRRIPPDPITNGGKWGLIHAPGGGVIGVHSISEAAPIKTGRFGLGEEGFSGKKKYMEWRFVYVPTINPNVLQSRPLLHMLTVPPPPTR